MDNVSGLVLLEDSLDSSRVPGEQDEREIEGVGQLELAFSFLASPSSPPLLPGPIMSPDVELWISSRSRMSLDERNTTESGLT